MSMCVHIHTETYICNVEAQDNGRIMHHSRFRNGLNFSSIPGHRNKDRRILKRE